MPLPANLSTPPARGTIREIVRFWAEHTPDAPAILAPGRPLLTYGRLLALIDAAVEKLSALGVSPEDTVAVILPNGPEMAAVFTGIAAAAACAPLNPAYREKELEFYLADLRPKAIVLQSGIEGPAASVAATMGIPIVRLAPVPGSAAGTFVLVGPPGRPAGAALSKPDDVALLLHTSGTTSRPKLVPLVHRGLCASAANIARGFALSPEDRCLNVMPLFHVHGLVGALLASISAGGSVVCAPGFYSTSFFDWLREFRPTWYTAVPTMHQSILARARSAGEAPAAFQLRFVRSCSAALPPVTMEEIERAFQAPVVESYGMTEAHHQVASNPLPPASRKPGSVGIPTGPEVAILDEAGNPLPPGGVGEVALRGDTVIGAYIAESSVNGQAFTNGWFRTGDQGYFDGDGYLFLNGRLKELINRGGEKIAPLEIETVLLAHPCIAQAVCFAVPHVQLGDDVGVAVILQDGAALTELEVRRHVAASLADFKVPAVVKFVTDFPKGPTGKIQRVNLARDLGISPVDPSSEAAPVVSSPLPAGVERALRQIWSDVLRIKEVRLHDNFFQSGGDSVLATQFVIRVNERLGTNLSLVEFLSGPSIAVVAGRMESTAGPRHSPEDARSKLVPIQPGGSKPPFFCAPGHDGDLVAFGMLAEALSPEQPLLGFFQPQYPSAHTVTAVAEIAARNIEEMLKRQPSGPYFLLGRCFGGLVVYEMACQLETLGRKVEILVMLDCYNPRWRRELPLRSLAGRMFHHAIRRARFHSRQLRRSAFKAKLEYLRSHGRESLRAGAEVLFVALKRTRLPVPGFLWDTRHANRLAARDWIPRPYSGSGILFRSDVPRAGAYFSPKMGWDGLFGGGIKVFEAPDKEGYLWTGPNVSFIARCLRDRVV